MGSKSDWNRICIRIEPSPDKPQKRHGQPSWRRADNVRPYGKLKDLDSFLLPSSSHFCVYSEMQPRFPSLSSPECFHSLRELTGENKKGDWRIIMKRSRTCSSTLKQRLGEWGIETKSEVLSTFEKQLKTVSMQVEGFILL